MISIKFDEIFSVIEACQRLLIIPDTVDEGGESSFGTYSLQAEYVST